MKVSINWLKELVDLKISMDKLLALLPLRTVGIKEVTKDYIELDMKGYNRADLLSLRGVTQEVSAISGSKLLFSAVNLPDYDLPETPVKIEDENLSSVQCVAKIEGLKFGKSREEWIEKLQSSGMRTVNNIADVTNLIMLEYGQPLHSFDANTVLDDTIIVRCAKEGEEIVTLDGKKRKLNKDDIVLADDEKALDVAGVMGGKDTEVKESTKTILLSASLFNPQMIMKTANKLGLHSEASKRFKHGLTKKRLLQAFAAAIKMYESLGGKLTAVTLTGNLKDQPKTIKLSQQKINSLIGIEIPSEEVETSLKKLGFTINPSWEVTVPYWRLDIQIEEDLIEEIARMYGYEKIPAKELDANIPDTPENPLFKVIYSLKQALTKQGLTEVQTYSFYSSQIIRNLKLEIRNLLHVANPISTETEYMRDNLWPNLLEVAAKNIKQEYKDIAIFEIGKVYSPVIGDLPKEVYHLSIALSNGTDNPIQELNQIAKNLKLQPNVEIEKQYCHPVRHTEGMAEIHPRYVNKFGVEQRIAVLEMEIKAPQ